MRVIQVGKLTEDLNSNIPSIISNKLKLLELNRISEEITFLTYQFPFCILHEARSSHCLK